MIDNLCIESFDFLSNASLDISLRNLLVLKNACEKYFLVCFFNL